MFNAPSLRPNSGAAEFTALKTAWSKARPGLIGTLLEMNVMGCGQVNYGTGQTQWVWACSGRTNSRFWAGICVSECKIFCPWDRGTYSAQRSCKRVQAIEYFEAYYVLCFYHDYVVFSQLRYNKDPYVLSQHYMFIFLTISKTPKVFYLCFGRIEQREIRWSLAIPMR